MIYPRIIIFFIISLLTQFPLSAQSPPGLYPFTSTRIITRQDVDSKNLSELKIMRNEIFARYGHTFKGEDLKKHFNAQAWYKPTITDATPLLTELEKQNVDMIKKWETRISSMSEFDSFYNIFTKAVKANDIAKLVEITLFEDSPFSTAEEFKNSYEIHRKEIREAIDTSSPSGDDSRQNLKFGEFHQGVQYRWVEFHKEGCCWYIYAFGAAG